MTTGFRKKLDNILGHALVLIMAVMVVNVLWQVFSRYVLGTPSSFTDELARFLMIWIGVLGAAYVAGRNGHVAIDVLARRTSGNNQKKLKQLVRIAIVLFCLFAMVIGGLRLVYVTYVLEQYSPALGLPLAVVYLVIPLSGLLIIYYKISDMPNS
ncbi:TRAP transporter small permease [Flagellimonas lutaonensis]|uniref:C4-dicarboxylate ABC transporter permease n=1 Tax=Flagellimonas lutaonensis TaxID=516051 RepID=A0A0D5YQL1_9FLAO|nr:TRAP transporter small permease [Allomuricauda lutaonensis]AKA34575.1 C4-dicarboxylate ABC transporter permease [Allomuricauda lutaonensis]